MTFSVTPSAVIAAGERRVDAGMDGVGREVEQERRALPGRPSRRRRRRRTRGQPVATARIVAIVAMRLTQEDDDRMGERADVLRRSSGLDHGSPCRFSDSKYCRA